MTDSSIIQADAVRIPLTDKCVRCCECVAFTQELEYGRDGLARRMKFRPRPLPPQSCTVFHSFSGTTGVVANPNPEPVVADAPGQLMMFEECK